jgi:hypothetical protein
MYQQCPDGSTETKGFRAVENEPTNQVCVFAISGFDW